MNLEKPTDSFGILLSLIISLFVASVIGFAIGYKASRDHKPSITAEINPATHHLDRVANGSKQWLQIVSFTSETISNTTVYHLTLKTE